MSSLFTDLGPALILEVTHHNSVTPLLPLAVRTHREAAVRVDVGMIAIPNKRALWKRFLVPTYNPVRYAEPGPPSHGVD